MDIFYFSLQQHPDLYKILHELCIRFAENPPVWAKRTTTIVEGEFELNHYVPVCTVISCVATSVYGAHVLD